MADPRTNLPPIPVPAPPLGRTAAFTPPVEPAQQTAPGPTGMALTATATPTSTATKEEPKKGLSTGAKVGIGAAVVLVIAGGLFLLLRKPKKGGRRR